MSNIIFSYDEESAKVAGTGGYINESGAYIITITEAELKAANNQDSQSKWIEFSGEADDGRKVQYLKVITAKRDGSPNKMGNDMIHAMMGAAGIRQLTNYMKQAGKYIAPEFTGKTLGLVIGKTLTTKNDGSDSYQLDIKIPFYPDTRQTITERAEGLAAESIAKIVAGLKDKDDRKARADTSQSQPNNVPFDDSIPFQLTKNANYDLITERIGGFVTPTRKHTKVLAAKDSGQLWL